MPRKWLAVAALLGVFALVALGAWGFEQYRAKKSMEIYLNNRYQRAFFDLAENAQRLEVLLSKSLVAADPRLDRSLLTDIRLEANFAQANLTQLPLTDALAGRTARFLTQSADYADSLIRQISRGEGVEKDHWNTLRDLYNQSVALNAELQGMQERVSGDNLYFGTLVREVRRSLQQAPGDLSQSDFQAIDKEMDRYPTLIYDGPFSEHLARTEPEALAGQPEIGPEEAVAKALAFIDRNPGSDSRAAVTGTTSGRIPAYRVEVTPAGGGDERTVMDISRRGGRVIWLLNSRPSGGQTLTVDQARDQARKFLAGRGFGEMQSNYFQRQAGNVTYNFTSVEKGVVLYPDLVKVTVALDNGEVTGLESSGYLMSHRKRDLPRAALTAEQARATLNPLFSVTGGRLVLIPAGVKEERLSYEFKGKLNEDTFLVYVDALSGREEKVLKLIETPGGTLTM